MGIPGIEFESKSSGKFGSASPKTTSVAKLKNWVDMQDKSFSTGLKLVSYFVKALDFKFTWEPPIEKLSQFLFV